MQGNARDFERIEQAIRFVQARALAQPQLDEIAAHIGLSPHHFQRLFQRWAGVSPKRFLQFLTAAHARGQLAAARTVLETTLDVGLSSTGRLHDLMVTVDAVTPGEIRQGGAGLCIRHGRDETPLGMAHVALTERGILSLQFETTPGEDPLSTLRPQWPRAQFEQDDAAAAHLLARVFGSTTAGSGVQPVVLRGTNLQLCVWEALLRMPEGTVTSYGALAALVGRPRATRAVASAVGANQIAYLIPCHRVLRASGALGGYRWGLARKQALLGHEFARTRVS